ncbi:hypothetical protein M0802_016875, partial [Mischocyttarus mexicanus]
KILDLKILLSGQKTLQASKFLVPGKGKILDLKILLSGQKTLQASKFLVPGKGITTE